MMKGRYKVEIVTRVWQQKTRDDDALIYSSSFVCVIWMIFINTIYN